VAQSTISCRLNLVVRLLGNLGQFNLRTKPWLAENGIYSTLFLLKMASLDHFSNDDD
jgi:hypothetical protein